jgi:hypothetical protein
MGKQSLNGSDIANLKLRVAEHIAAQYDCYRAADVPTILAETKVGAWRRTDLEKKLKMLFSAS